MRTNWCTGVSAADDRPVLDRDVAGELHGVGEDDVVADAAVVGDVRVGHEQAVARRCASSRPRSLARFSGHVLADHRVLADLEVRRLAAVLEVLRRAAQHGAVVDVRSRAERGPARRSRTWLSSTHAVAERRRRGPMTAERPDAHVGRRGAACGSTTARGVDRVLTSSLRPRSRDRSSASATSWPST